MVEYVQDKHGPLIQDTLIQDKLQDTSDDESPADEMSTNPVARSVTSHTEGSSLCSKSPPSPPPPPRLSYNYPPPSPTILTNITHTLASIPKFYVQVYHRAVLTDRWEGLYTDCGVCIGAAFDESDGPASTIWPSHVSPAPSPGAG